MLLDTFFEKNVAKKFPASSHLGKKAISWHGAHGGKKCPPHSEVSSWPPRNQ